jgi:hypothetical protein
MERKLSDRIAAAIEARSGRVTGAHVEPKARPLRILSTSASRSPMQGVRGGDASEVSSPSSSWMSNQSSPEGERSEQIRSCAHRSPASWSGRRAADRQHPARPRLSTPYPSIQ